MDLLHINEFYQYLIHDLLDQVIYFFPDPEPQIFNMDGQEFLDNLDYVLLCFFCNTVKVKHFCIVLLYCYS